MSYMNEKAQLELLISSDAIFASGQQIILNVILINRSDSSILLLKWYTPFEGLLSDCLDVRFNGKPILYDGPLLKRGTPGIENFVLLSSGESISTDVNLGQAYQVSQPGKYEVSYKSGIFGYITSDSTFSDSDLIATGRELPSLLLVSHKIQFTVVGNSVIQLTLGEAARQIEYEKLQSLNIQTEIIESQLKPPFFNGGTVSQQSKTQLAHKAGYQLAVGALNQLKNDPHYIEWFGKYVDSRFFIVKATYQKVVDRMNSTIFTYDLTGYRCSADTFAYTYRGGTTIWLCSLFWNNPDNGTNSKAGAVFHEHTHASADTVDMTYGQVQCRALARIDPTKAVQNADNYQYYCGG